MKLPRRRAELHAAMLLLAGVTWVSALPPREAGCPPGQAVTPSAPPAPVNPPTRELTAEQRADVYMARKNYAEAADYYMRALKQASYEDPALWNKLGIAFQEQNKFRSAHKAYERATRLDKSFAEGWNNIGTVYFMRKKYKKSVSYYQQAIKLKGNSAAFHMNLGTSYYHLKMVARAVDEYRTALNLDPQVVVEQSATGTVVHAGGTDADFYFFMAKAYAEIGNPEEAVRYLRRAMEDGAGDPERISGDPDFKKINQYPAFVELMRNPPVAIKN